MDAINIDAINIDAWENEGGAVDDWDWEPSESEVCMATDTAKKCSVEQTHYLFTCLVADAIRHVKKFFFNRIEVATEPTVAQQVGEFVTEIRRLFRDEYKPLGDVGFHGLTDTDMWVNVGVPNDKAEYKWKFTYSTTDGFQPINLALTKILCENAIKMATSDKTMDEEFREINNSLNNLMRETTALDTLIYKAKELNGQAATVVDNLCAIAEKLNQE
jgi:hypothetical protein